MHIKDLPKSGNTFKKVKNDKYESCYVQIQTTEVYVRNIQFFKNI